MRILKIVQAYEPFREMGGAVVKVRAIARGLQQRDHQVTILTANLGLNRFADFRTAYTPSQWGHEALHDGIHSIYLPTRVRYRALTFNPTIWAYLRNNLGHFDVVHIYGMYDLLGPATARACRSMGMPYLLEPMGMFRPIVRNIALKRGYHRIWGRRMARGARYLIATSPMEAAELAADRIPRDQIVIRRNGIEMPSSLPAAGAFRMAWEISADAPMILFLGRVVSKKSPDMLLSAFAGWRAESPRGHGAVLVIAGPDEGDGYYAQLQQTASRLGVANQVRFTGPVYDTQKWAAYRDADVFVLPSQDENFGNSAGEAAAAGAPVILTDRCGIAPLLEGHGAAVVSHDCVKLTEALHAVLDGADAQGARTTRSVEAAEALSWTSPLDELEALYRNMSVSSGKA